jgi:hypothetical protein
MLEHADAEQLAMAVREIEQMSDEEVSALLQSGA